MYENSKAVKKIIICCYQFCLFILKKHVPFSLFLYVEIYSYVIITRTTA